MGEVVWTLPPGGVGGTSGTFWGGIGVSENGFTGCDVGDGDNTGPGGGG